MAKFDLTSSLAPYLDRHLVFPLLEFLSAKKVSRLACSVTSEVMFLKILELPYWLTA